MRVYISADIEGVGGIAHLASTGPKRIDWETSARQWMTNEVLAAIAALPHDAIARDGRVVGVHGALPAASTINK